MVSKRVGTRRRSTVHRSSATRAHTRKKNSVVKKRATRVVKKTKPVRGSNSRSQQSRKISRNSDGTFAKTKKVSPGISKKRSQAANSRRRNSLGQFVKDSSVSKCPQSSVKRSTASSKSSSHYTVAQKRLISSIPRIGTAESTTKELMVAKNIPITGGTVKKQEEIVAAISDNFTVKEIEMMSKGNNRPVVKVSAVGGGADASHERKTQGNSKPARIVISNEADTSAIVHEFTHHSRSVDPTRRGISKTVYPQNRYGRTSASHYGKTGSSLRLHNAEECATTAETTVRVKKESDRPANYFSELGERDPFTGNYKSSRKENYKSDRNVLRTYSDQSKVPDGKSIKGVNAIKMFLRNYKNTRISKKSIGGETAETTSKKASKKQD